MKKRLQTAAAKRKHEEKKAAASGSSASGSRPPKKLRKKKDDSDDDIDDGADIEITVYIHIPMNAPTTSRRKSKKSEAPETLQKGPFKLSSTTTYASFLSKIASTLPCRTENIYQQKMFWKPQKPMNAQPLLLGNTEGYEAMVTAMAERKKERVVIVSMPPPAEPMEDVNPWPTAEGDEPQPAFDYSALERPDASDSIEQQKLTFNKATKTEREKLEAEYPIGNCPLFPTLRIYHDPKTNYYFDLTTM
ncbi:hypothetical protein FB451DRAFT_238066 [Mycena latifolia]|nr:hypothetical protein FB451DRAFT_238066 [Mycena latifolia]